MKQTFKSRLRRVAASALAAAAMFSQPILTENAVYAAEPKAAGSPVKVPRTKTARSTPGSCRTGMSCGNSPARRTW